MSRTQMFQDTPPSTPPSKFSNLEKYQKDSLYVVYAKGELYENRSQNCKPNRKRKCQNNVIWNRNGIIRETVAGIVVMFQIC